MAAHRSPSPILEVFVRAVGEELPDDQQAKLAPFRPRIEATTDHHDGRRARRCARWAIETAGERDLPHHEWRRIMERHAVWKDLVFGAEFALDFEDSGVHPVQDAEIEWVEDAVKVAGIVGGSVGWEHARWEELLEELLGMEG